MKTSQMYGSKMPEDDAKWNPRFKVTSTKLGESFVRRPLVSWQDQRAQARACGEKPFWGNRAEAPIFLARARPDNHGTDVHIVTATGDIYEETATTGRGT